MVQFKGMKHTRALVIGNWKLNPGTSIEAKSLALAVKKCVAKCSETQVVVAPPFLFIPEVARSLTKTEVKLGAQDAHFEERGACTGEISPVILATFGVTHIIVGHSERRALGETNEQVNRKIHTILKRKQTPIVCIGERVRDTQGLFFNEIEEQIRSLAEGLTPMMLSRIVIAYEPIWAIGTGATATAEDVKEMQIFIVSVLTKLYERKVAAKVHLIYGGSVKSSNALELYKDGGMNGFLVGGASLQADEFAAIVVSTLPRESNK
jgi:triosephosphate isomerase